VLVEQDLLDDIAAGEAGRRAFFLADRPWRRTEPEDLV
jgi:hypothetical protein